MNITKKTAGLYWKLAVAITVLCVASLIVWRTHVPQSRLTQLSAADAQKNGSAKMIAMPVSYQVVEDYESSNGNLPQHQFGPLQLNKAKVNRGVQYQANQGHVLGEFASPDGLRMVYFIQRQQLQQEQSGWAQVDMVAYEPQSQQMMIEPIGFTYGDHLESALQSTTMCGYLSNETFLYTTVRNEDEMWVYRVNQYDLAHKKVTPLMELYRVPYTSAAGELPVIYSTQLTPDKKHLFVRDSINGITAYSLETGEKKQAAPGSNEIKPDEYFELRADGGAAVYGTARYQNDLWWFDPAAGTARQPFTAEQGLVDVGADAKGNLMYYNFTYDRAADNWMTGETQKLLLPKGVQVMDAQGNPVKRFSLPKESKERLEFGGYSESKKAVLLHKFAAAVNNNGQPFKKTDSWLLGDLTTGSMTPLNKVDVPDSWDKKDVVFGNVTVNVAAVSAEQQVFVNTADNTYYMCRWKTKLVRLLDEDDTVLYQDEQNKRIYVSSLTRPDLVVAALSYKKYNWDNQRFSWLNGHWITRSQKLPEGDKMYFFQWN
ncbi:hypothetical protein [Paenibacillus piri]|uniref:Uncharacterized protein n=1 Tax=Paenibacillus piri TaxID=2547395 RepID=A0A4R5KJZ8_9BACL|nr:hypothetical protein [Paenibacillus piri]TDF95879.1 hypothetical protein E1757_19335 [Paenibacillus piri]